MANLVLHIGTHKTGTTYIQHLMARNARLLRRTGVAVPKMGIARAHHPLAGAWNERFAGRKNGREAWISLARDWSDFDGTVFVSSEELSRLYGPQRVDFAEMRELCSPFERVKLICVLRNQANFLQSAYQQISRFRVPPAWSKVLETALEKQRFDGLTLNYDRLCSRIYDGFSRTEVRFVAYDAARREPDGLVRTLFSEVGCLGILGHVKNPDATRANRSQSPLATLLANRLAAPRVPTERQRAQAQTRLACLLGPASQTTLFTRSEVTAMTDAFDASNAALAARIAPYQPGFAIGPMLPRGADIWRDEFDQILAAA